MIRCFRKVRNNMDELIQVIENATEPWEEIQCKECGAVIRFHPTKAMKKCEYFEYGQKHINEYIDCPKCYCTVLRYPIR